MNRGRSHPEQTEQVIPKPAYPALILAFYFLVLYRGFANDGLCCNHYVTHAVITAHNDPVEKMTVNLVTQLIIFCFLSSLFR